MERVCWPGNILVTCKISDLKVGSLFILAYEHDGNAQLW